MFRRKLFLKDPRLSEAKQLLLESLKEHQSELNSIQPAKKELKIKYERVLKAFQSARGSALWYPYVSSGLGNGPYIELEDGSVKLDFITGIGVHGWGHSNAELTETLFQGILEDTVMQGNLQQGGSSLEVMKSFLALAKQSGSRLDRVFLTTSGAMANENALKIAFQKNAPANRILAFRGAFAGRTMAMASLTDKPQYRKGIPQTLQVDYIPFYDAQRPEKSTQRALKRLDDHLKRYPGQYAAIWMEMIQGENGFYPGTANFFQAIAKVCKENGVAVVVDEIQTFGRTENPFAFQTFEMEKYVDIATVGKITQVCATLYRKDYQPQPGLISQTFTGSTSSIRAGQHILQEYLRGDLCGPKGLISQYRKHFERKIKALQKAFPKSIKGPFGYGMMIAMTLFDGDKVKTMKFLKDCFDEGLITFGAGANPLRVRFLPPVGVLNKKDIDVAFEILEKVLKKS